MPLIASDVLLLLFVSKGGNDLVVHDGRTSHIFANERE